MGTKNGMFVAWVLGWPLSWFGSKLIFALTEAVRGEAMVDPSTFSETLQLSIMVAAWISIGTLLYER